MPLARPARALLRALALLSLPPLLALAASAGAHRALAPVELEVIDRSSGQPLPRYRHAGQYWLAAQPGQAYAVRLRNTSPQRLLVVLSVDGINAIDGRTAAPDQAGYVLGPWQTLEVAGWRKSLQEVAAFEFSEPGRSYAARTGRPADIGVIGIAVFGERRPPAVAAIADEGPQARRSRGVAAEASVPGARAPAPAVAQQLGTGHGRREGAPAYHTRFQRQDRPLQLAELRYDTPGALAARGIPVPPTVADQGHRPRAFPGSFVPDPPGR